jgi:hypothetical protein
MLNPQVTGKSATAFASAVATVALGCIHHQTGGYPLYEPASPRRPTADVARLFGPIASVDGRDVSGLGRSFELLPGCHVVVTQKQMLEFDNAASVSGQFPPRTYLFWMKAAHTYVIERPTTGIGGARAITWIEAYDAAPSGRRFPVGATNNERAIDDCRASRPE